MWASADFHWKSAYDNTFPHKFILKNFNDSYTFFKVLPKVNKSQFVNNFSSRKAHERNEVCMSGSITGLFLTFLLDLDTKSKHPSVPNPPDFTIY